MRDLPGDEVSVTAAPTPVDSTALDLADEMAVAVQEFVIAVERVAAGGLGGAVVGLLVVGAVLLVRRPPPPGTL